MKKVVILLSDAVKGDFEEAFYTSMVSWYYYY